MNLSDDIKTVQESIRDYDLRNSEEMENLVTLSWVCWLFGHSYGREHSVWRDGDMVIVVAWHECGWCGKKEVIK